MFDTIESGSYGPEWHGGQTHHQGYSSGFEEESREGGLTLTAD